MGELIQFPSKGELCWSVYKEPLEIGLYNRGFSKDETEYLTSRIEAYFNLINQDFSFGFDLKVQGTSLSPEENDLVLSQVKEAFNEYTKKVHNFANQVLANRVLFEIELYKKMGGEKLPLDIL